MLCARRSAGQVPAPKSDECAGGGCAPADRIGENLSDRAVALDGPDMQVSPDALEAMKETWVLIRQAYLFVGNNKILPRNRKKIANGLSSKLN